MLCVGTMKFAALRRTGGGAAGAAYPRRAWERRPCACFRHLTNDILLAGPTSTRSERSAMRSIACLALVGMIGPTSARAAAKPTPTVVFGVNGGGGVTRRDKLTQEGERDIRANLDKALDLGYAVLKRGGTSLDAVETAIRM